MRIARAATAGKSHAWRHLAADGRIPLYGPYADLRLRLPADPADPLLNARLSVAARAATIEAGERLTARRKTAGRRPLFFHRFAGGLLTAPLVRIRAAGPDDVPTDPGSGGAVWSTGQVQVADAFVAGNRAGDGQVLSVRRGATPDRRRRRTPAGW